ncbi:single-stranded DNA-binding protein [Kitasatospora sp. NPDC059577]|uniref:single-stranded DNA-binding protein n=1 Tax=Kitasatospora sp. NPDC059577 TaxID=3346873 RepID=UPI003679D3C0
MPEHERQANFDGAAIAKALNTDATPVSDPAFGKGQHFQVESEKTFLSLDTFPETGVSRITTKGARIELFGGLPPTVEEEGVVFLQKDADHEHASLALHPDGAITMGYQVDTGPAPVAGLPDEEAHDDQEPAKKVVTPSAKPPEKSAKQLNRMPGAYPDVRPMIHQVGQAPAGAPSPETDAQAAEDPLARAARIRATDQAKQSPAPAEQGSEDERERVKVTGRLGRNPTIRETRGGKLVAKFPLALHNEDGTTTWRDVLAFNERAAALQKRIEAGELVKGREVDVVGYLHEREYKGRDGTPKMAQEIYSVAITSR